MFPLSCSSKSNLRGDLHNPSAEKGSFREVWDILSGYRLRALIGEPFPSGFDLLLTHLDFLEVT